MMTTSRIRIFVQLALLFSVWACQAPQSETDKEVLEGPGLQASEMLAYLEAKIDIADDKFMQLAEAIPEESYDWRPMDGVRSFREVFIHIAADNWYGAALLEIPPPDDITVTAEGESVQAYQAQMLSKAEILVHLRRSFDHFSVALAETSDQLDRPVMLRTTELTAGDLWVRLVTHMHEHLGQTIAYARMNEIVPPWSRP